MKETLRAYRLPPPHDSEDVYEVAIKIRQVASGEIVSYLDYLYWDADNDIPHTFIWEEGNYSCDCNRSLFFHRNKGLKDDQFEESECGDEDYEVEITNPKTGEVIYSDLGLAERKARDSK
jgi:hypothetical protein